MLINTNTYCIYNSYHTVMSYAIILTTPPKHVTSNQALDVLLKTHQEPVARILSVINKKHMAIRINKTDL